jgi:hypothetical protein
MEVHNMVITILIMLVLSMALKAAAPGADKAWRGKEMFDNANKRLGIRLTLEELEELFTCMNADRIRELLVLGIKRQQLWEAAEAAQKAA